MPALDGTMRANEKGKPMSAQAARGYIAGAFGDRLEEVRAEMAALATSLPPDELNRVEFRWYENLRPEVPRGTEGWGAQEALRVDRIRSAANPRRR